MANFYVHISTEICWFWWHYLWSLLLHISVKFFVVIILHIYLKFLWYFMIVPLKLFLNYGLIIIYEVLEELTLELIDWNFDLYKSGQKIDQNEMNLDFIHSSFMNLLISGRSSTKVPTNHFYQHGKNFNSFLLSVWTYWWFLSFLMSV